MKRALLFQPLFSLMVMALVLSYTLQVFNTCYSVEWSLLKDERNVHAFALSHRSILGVNMDALYAREKALNVSLTINVSSKVLKTPMTYISYGKKSVQSP